MVNFHTVLPQKFEITVQKTIYKIKFAYVRNYIAETSIKNYMQW
jgi:hypothetical protein